MRHAITQATKTEFAAAVRRTATANGTGLDVTAYEGTIAIVLMSSAGGGTSPTMDVKIQESNDDGSSDAYADVSGATFTQVTDGADSFEVLELDLDAREQWIRPVFTIAGTSPTFDCGIAVIGYKKRLGGA